MNWFDDVPMSKICDRLYVSGYVQASRLSTDNPLGIQSVLDVSTDASWEHSNPYVESPDIVYAHIPFHDGEEIPEEAFWACMNFLYNRYLQGDNVLIHCAAGISRSITIAASFMHYAHIMQFADALECIKIQRPVANPAIAVLRSAKQLLRVWPYDSSMS
jgi:protein-tyrosine phosphatase